MIVPLSPSVFNLSYLIILSIQWHLTFFPFLGDFFNGLASICLIITALGFRLLPRGSFFNTMIAWYQLLQSFVFVPFLGDLFSMVCLESGSLSVLVSGFAAGMGKLYHKIIF